ncbi:proton-coupled folate transporter-like [Patiria miniata]|uniref:Proton-coupled folate transporter n=1 Tax=Patiria miniata TaxID=46514 RepID=A0A914AET5_PATMI|nr:proton-coupled folate transporter-like [Patiria miniata]
MAEGGKNLGQLLPLKLVLTIYAFLSGLVFGAIFTASLQALRFLVSNELGYGEGDDKMASMGHNSPCSALNDTYANNASAAANVEVQERTALLATVTSIVGNIPSAAVTILASARMDSDSANEKSIQLLPCVGVTLHMAIYIIIMQFTLSPWFALIPIFILGISGSFFLQFATMLKYLGKITDEQDRSSNLLLLAMFNFGAQGIAQIGIGYLIEGAGFTMTFTILFLICALTTVFVFLFLPNTESNASPTDGTDNDVGTTSRLPSLCTHTLAVFKDPDTGKWNSGLIVSALAMFLYSQISFYFLAILQIVALGEPFCWSPSLIGYFSAAKLIGVAIGMTLGTKILRTWFDDNGLIQIGFISMVISTVIPIYARTDAGLFLVVVFGAFRMIPGPILTANVSKMVKKNSMGSVFGVTMAIECLASLMGPTVFGTVYEATVEDNPHLVFRLMAGMTAIPSALILCLQCWECTSGAANYREGGDDTLLPSSSSNK